MQEARKKGVLSLVAPSNRITRVLATSNSRACFSFIILEQLYQGASRGVRSLFVVTASCGFLQVLCRDTCKNGPQGKDVIKVILPVQTRQRSRGNRMRRLDTN
jgi:hypothetical protein